MKKRTTPRSGEVIAGNLTEDALLRDALLHVTEHSEVRPPKGKGWLTREELGQKLDKSPATVGVFLAGLRKLHRVEVFRGKALSQGGGGLMHKVWYRVLPRR